MKTLRILFAVVAVVAIVSGVWDYRLHHPVTSPAPVVPAAPIVPTSTVVDPGRLNEVYLNTKGKYSMRYAPGYHVDSSYAYQGLGSGKSIKGVKFTIPPSMATGTNLADDTYLSVEVRPRAKTCSGSLFLDAGAITTTSTVVDMDVTYSVASAIGAGAGNRYEETVYAFAQGETCVGVRYFLHYGAIENYPEGRVQEFNREKLTNEFDAMRRTLVMM